MLGASPNPYLALSVRDRAIVYAALCAQRFREPNPLVFIARAHEMTLPTFQKELERIMEMLEATELVDPGLPEPK